MASDTVTAKPHAAVEAEIEKGHVDAEVEAAP